MTTTNTELVEQALRRYFVEHTGFVTADEDEGTVSAYYGGHWITISTTELARAALNAEVEEG
jgi:hypothetical protein